MGTRKYRRALLVTLLRLARRATRGDDWSWLRSLDDAVSFVALAVFPW